MKVFRLCRKDEALQILTQRSLENLGKYGVNNKNNTHTYNEKIKYLHFFKNQFDLFFLNTLKNRFICVYDIPEALLNQHYGYGKYIDYINFKTLCKAEEYAIPSNLVKFEYLQSIFKITKDIDYEDIQEDSSLTESIQIIYNQIINTEKTM